MVLMDDLRSRFGFRAGEIEAGRLARNQPFGIGKEIKMGRPVVHWEFMSKDPENVSGFYAKIFGWKVTHHPQINYRVVETGAKGPMPGINGGILKPDREGPWPGNMLFYILVDDLAAYREKIVAAGGKIHVEEQAVPGMGTLSLFTDPEGRMNGLWKAAARKPARKAAGKPAKKAARKRK
jgi:predicted enzyme related to lactoylglutathione lyase